MSILQNGGDGSPVPVHCKLGDDETLASLAIWLSERYEDELAVAGHLINAQVFIKEWPEHHQKAYINPFAGQRGRVYQLVFNLAAEGSLISFLVRLDSGNIIGPLSQQEFVNSKDLSHEPVPTVKKTPVGFVLAANGPMAIATIAARLPTEDEKYVGLPVRMMDSKPDIFLKTGVIIRVYISGDGRRFDVKLDNGTQVWGVCETELAFL